MDRTLFFDFLPLELGTVKGFKTRFHLYTVPGQVYYDASRKLILRGVDGIVFVADSQSARYDANIESLYNLHENLDEYKLKLDDVPFVLQYNKRDMEDVIAVDELERGTQSREVPQLPGGRRQRRRRLRHAQVRGQRRPQEALQQLGEARTRATVVTPSRHAVRACYDARVPHAHAPCSPIRTNSIS